jgi:dTDP-4-amino-4,6-dideoxygalactose transaminase
MKVPFNDLYALHAGIKDELNDTLSKVIETNAFIEGRFLEAFERNFAAKLGVRHCIGVGSGTAAIWIALKMAGVKDADEVILPANTYVACVEAIKMTGAKPVYADNDAYFNLDPVELEMKISSKTKAVLPVHMYGQPAQMDEISKICPSHDLIMIEDCAQSHFSKFKGQYTGTFGNAATFSFYPGKNIGAMGDAGCIVTNDDTLARKIRLFRNHGFEQKNVYEIEGFNSRMDGIQAAILNLKLKYVDRWNEKRRTLAKMYLDLLSSCTSISLPEVRDLESHVFHLFVIKAEYRDELRNFLTAKGIGTGIHYVQSLPEIALYNPGGDVKKEFPNSVKNRAYLLSLPIYPDMTAAQLNYVVSSIVDFYKERN